jgi:hypothetical protein
MTSGGESEHVCSVSPITIYIDAEACRVKRKIYRVAQRHALKGTALKVLVVSNSPIAVPRDQTIERVERVCGSEVVMAGLVPAIHDFPNARRRCARQQQHKLY